MRNFLACVKSRQKPVCDIEIGHHSTTTSLLANVSYRSKQKIEWDGSNERITNGKEANRYLTKAYRRPWELKV